MDKIEKTTLLSDALSFGNVAKVAETLQGFGMHCFGCALAKGETVEEAAMVHGVDPDVMVQALNEAANS